MVVHSRCSGLLLLLAAAVVCQGQAPAVGNAPDLVIVNGKVVTMDDRGTTAEAVAIEGERITAVGSSARIKQLAGAKTRVVDAGGRLVMPGIVDAHSHTSGVPTEYLDLSKATSVAQVREAVAKKIASKRPGEWVVGSGDYMIYSGWDDKRLKEHRWLTRQDIDDISPNNPVLLWKEAGHALLVNSYAMRLAKIDKNTPDPKKEIVRDPQTGEPTGVLLEGAMGLALQVLPTLTAVEKVGAAQHASDQLLAWGTTTVGDASVHDELAHTLQLMHNQAKKPVVSTIMMPRVPETATKEKMLEFIRSWRVTTGFGDQRIRVGALKFFLDGGVTSLSAWFTEPYKNKAGHFGIQQIDRETLFEAVRLGDALGWQLHFHACGDAAAELALQALEAAYAANPARDRRHGLTHIYVLSADQIARMKKLGVVAVIQPNFVYGLAEHMEAALSDKQLEHYIPFRTLLAAGVPVALSADGHPQNPLYGIWAAVARVGETGHKIGEAEAVSVMEAVRAYTRTSSYSLFEEDRRGSLEPGKLADVIILDRDLFSVPTDQIKDAKVLLTVKHGVVAVDRLAAGAAGAQ